MVCSGLSTDICMPQNAFDNFLSDKITDLKFYLKLQGFISAGLYLFLYLFSTLFLFINFFFIYKTSDFISLFIYFSILT